MIWYKGCPRCQGDVWLETDLYGSYLSCVQCGMLSDAPSLLDDEPPSRPRRERRRLKVASVR